MTEQKDTAKMIINMEKSKYDLININVTEEKQRKYLNVYLFKELQFKHVFVYKCLFAISYG